MRSLTVHRVRARFASHSNPIPASARTRVAGDGYGIPPVLFTTTVIVAITGAPACAFAPRVPPFSPRARRPARSTPTAAPSHPWTAVHRAGTRRGRTAGIDRRQRAQAPDRSRATARRPK